MTQKITTSKGTFIFVEVPENINKRYGYGYEFGHAKLQSLPYELLATTKSITEYQAKELVENISYGGFGRSGEEWKNYYPIKHQIIRTALDSFKSLLTANFIDPTKCYAILKIKDK